MIEWGRIEGAVERALLVATGPSMTLDPGSIRVGPDTALIAVNGAGWRLPSATHWVTVDPSAQNQAIMIHGPEGPVRYVAAYDHYQPTSEERERVVFLRRLLGNGYKRAHFGLSDDPERLATGNSCYGALGVAYALGARRIAILGLDGTRAGYWHLNARPRGSFDHLPVLFASAWPQLSRRGVEVLNGSPQSRIDCFARVRPEEAVAWINESRPRGMDVAC